MVTPEPPNALGTCEVIERIVIRRMESEASITLDSVDHDSLLFELGIDSLVVGMIAGDLELEFNKALKPEVVYELETIREIADHLDTLPEKIDVESPSSTPAAEPTPAGPDSLPSADPISYYTRLNRKVNDLKASGNYPFEPEIGSHTGAWVQCEGQRMLMLASYEYLGLLGHKDLNQAAADAIERFGTGHHGSRLLTGTTSLHQDLESRLARLMEADAAIVYSSGYVANLATISALVGPGDYVIGDNLNHASIIDGCRMSGADFVEYPHNQLDELDKLLANSQGRRTLIVVDAIFSMEGDIVDLPRVIELAQKYNALLMVDEAHSLGVLGKTGRGIQEHFDIDPKSVHIKMGTLSKSLAGSGGFVAGDEQLITYLRHHARGYIFSGALPAVYANIAIAALIAMESEPERVTQLWENVRYYRDGLAKLGFDMGACETPIVPLMTKSNDATMALSQVCRKEGLLVAPVCYPAVPMDAPRLRTCITSVHNESDLDFALDVLGRAGRQCGVL